MNPRVFSGQAFTMSAANNMEAIWLHCWMAYFMGLHVAKHPGVHFRLLVIVLKVNLKLMGSFKMQTFSFVNKNTFIFLGYSI